MDVNSIFISSIPQALDGLKRIAADIWAEDYIYIIAFLLFVIICVLLKSKMKKNHLY